MDTHFHSQVTYASPKPIIRLCLWKNHVQGKLRWNQALTVLKEVSVLNELKWPISTARFSNPTETTQNRYTDDLTIWHHLKNLRWLRLLRPGVTSCKLYSFMTVVTKILPSKIWDGLPWQIAEFFRYISFRGASFKRYCSFVYLDFPLGIGWVSDWQPHLKLALI